MQSHRGRIVWKMFQSFFDCTSQRHFFLCLHPLTVNHYIFFFIFLSGTAVVASGLGLFCTHTDLITAPDRSAYATRMARCIWATSRSLGCFLLPVFSHSLGLLGIPWVQQQDHTVFSWRTSTRRTSSLYILFWMLPNWSCTIMFHPLKDKQGLYNCMFFFLLINITNFKQTNYLYINGLLGASFSNFLCEQENCMFSSGGEQGLVNVSID